MAASPKSAAHVPDPDNDNLATFELARQEELRLLELQRTQVDNIRTRTAQYLAFVGSASAFMAGSGLRAVDRDGWFYLAAGTATALSALSVALGCALFGNINPAKVLKKSKRRLVWAWGSKGGGHALAHARSQVPVVSASDLAQKLADRYQTARRLNADKLLVVQQTFVWFLVAGSVQLLAWTIVVWTRGA